MTVSAGGCRRWRRPCSRHPPHSRPSSRDRTRNIDIADNRTGEHPPGRKAQGDGLDTERRALERVEGRSCASSHSSAAATVAPREPSHADCRLRLGSRCHHWWGDSSETYPDMLSAGHIPLAGGNRRTASLDADLKAMPAGGGNAARREAQDVAAPELVEDSDECPLQSIVEEISSDCPPVCSLRLLTNPTFPELPAVTP